MSKLRKAIERNRVLAAATLSLYAVALLLGAAHPLFHDDLTDADHFGAGLCGTGCEEHHVDAEDCNTCATLIKKVSSPGENFVRVDRPAIKLLSNATSVVVDSLDTRLPGLRAPPAVA